MVYDPCIYKYAPDIFHTIYIYDMYVCMYIYIHIIIYIYMYIIIYIYVHIYIYIYICIYIYEYEWLHISPWFLSIGHRETGILPIQMWVNFHGKYLGLERKDLQARLRGCGQ